MLTIRKGFVCAALLALNALADSQEFIPEVAVGQDGSCDDTTKMQTWKLEDLTPEQIAAGSMDTRHLEPKTSQLNKNEILSSDSSSSSAKISDGDLRAPERFSFAEGTLLENIRQLAAKMPGAETALSEKALAYKPASEDLLFHTADDGRYARRIYKSNDLREGEKLLNQQFYEYVSERNPEMLTWAFDEHNFSLRYTASFQQNFEKSYNMLIQYQDWMRDRAEANLDYNRWKKWIEEGVIYAHGRDKQMRPILHVNMKKFAEANVTTEEIIGFSDYMHAYLSFNAMVPGTIEQWVVIWDCKDMPISQLPASSIASLVEHGTYAWKQRNGQGFFIHLHWLARFLWKIFQSFLDQFQAETNIVLGADFYEDFDRVIGLENLQEMYGGSRPNVKEGEFYPPQLD